MITHTKFAKERQQYEEQRNLKMQRRMLEDNGGVKWERPTYMSQIGVPSAMKHSASDYMQYIKDTQKPGGMMTDAISTRPTEIVLPGTGFGNASIHGNFLSKNCRNLESRLWGLGLSHPHHPAPPPELTPMKIKTLHTNPPAPYITVNPIDIVQGRPSMW